MGMALYAIGDLHLCLGAPKPMDIFGGAWVGYMDKLVEGLSVITPDDTTVLLGDLSWALGMEAAKDDFAFMNRIPGRKIILKGNHDYWWSTAAKFYKFCEENGFENFHILNNNCYDYGDIAICGTRGWFFEEERSGQHDEKVFKRELLRLEASLKAAGEKRKIVFLHYPPRYRGYICQEILDLLAKYEVRQCFYGHLHGPSHGLAQEGLWDGVDFKLVAADKLQFHPWKVLD
jgi:predicted phosphohydrolase